MQLLHCNVTLMKLLILYCEFKFGFVHLIYDRNQAGTPNRMHINQNFLKYV